jgi:Protein of unknown function (DUF998)
VTLEARRRDIRTARSGRRDLPLLPIGHHETPTKRSIRAGLEINDDPDRAVGISGMSKPLITTRPVSRVAASAARVSISSGGLFILFLGSLHLLEPGFDPTWRFVSEYALSKFGWMMRLAFLCLAASLASAGVAIFFQVRTIAGYIGLAILDLAAIGLLIAAAFTTDPATTPREAATFSGKMHVLSAALDYTPIGALLLSFSLARARSWCPIRRWLFITAGITLVVLTASSVPAYSRDFSGDFSFYLTWAGCLYSSSLL